MTLHFHFHPFASFCQKVLIALYENATQFDGHVVNLGDPDASAAFKALWPVGKMPVLGDDARGEILAESSLIIEYLQLHYPGPTRFIPADPERALSVRKWDRFFDLYVEGPMQKIVTDRIRPAGQYDRFGVAQARAQLGTALDMVERRMAGRDWVTGDAFSMAECAAAPALHYAELVLPFADTHPNTHAYLARLKARRSFARVLEEAAYFLPYFPKDPDAG